MIRKLVMKLNHMRLREKMLVLYVFAILIPIVVTNLIFYTTTAENVKNQRIQDITRTMQQIRNEVRAEIEDAVGVSAVLMNDYLLNDILETTYNHPAEYIYAYDSYARRVLNSWTPVYHSVQSITIYVDNPTISPAGGSIQQITDDVKQSTWYQALAGQDQSYPLFIRTYDTRTFRSEPSQERDTFSILRHMNIYGTQNTWTKILKIDLRSDTMWNIFNNDNLQGHVYLLNQNGEIEYTTDPDIRWSVETVRYDQVVPNDNMIEFSESIESLNYMDGWTVSAYVSETEIIEEVRKSRFFILYLTAIIMIIPTLVILWMVRVLNSRIIRILKHMKKVQNENFQTIQEEQANDEIGQLTSEFNRMTLQIESLINDVYRADIHSKSMEIQQRQAQLQALQSQINPHFIFNSLETLRMRSMMKKETETARIIHNMAKIMRNSLSWNKDKLTVQEELHLIHCFLEIQKYRFGDKLTYHIDVDESVLDCYIPKMTFLPFVENASIHGIESLKSDGLIELSIKRSGRYLRFDLRDNGIGMSEEKQALIRSYLVGDTEMGDRIGVQNVIYRLRLYYKDQFRFHLESKPEGGGTYIQLELPLESNG